MKSGILKRWWNTQLSRRKRKFKAVLLVSVAVYLICVLNGMAWFALKLFALQTAMIVFGEVAIARFPADSERVRKPRVSTRERPRAVSAIRNFLRL